MNTAAWIEIKTHIAHFFLHIFEAFDRDHT